MTHHITGLEEARYWNKVHRQEPAACWRWKNATTDGYGVCWVGHRVVRATHVALLLDGRPRIGNSNALHSCDNPICVNPAHLRWGTKLDNCHDKIARGRDRGFQPGEAHHNARLTDAQVVEIRASSGATQAYLAIRYGVTQGTISRLRAGKRRK